MSADIGITDLREIFFSLDIAGTFVFAATGALASARHKHDVVAFGFFACMTGIGGGTIRDILLGLPVFWLNQPAYIIACLMAAVLVWIFGGLKFKYGLVTKFDIVTWLDAIGMAAFSVVGASKALSAGVSPLTAIIMGVITCVCGGILRDVLSNQQSILLRREIYITAALLGSASFVGLEYCGLSFWAGAIPAIILAFWLRASAILYGWQLPSFKRNID